MRNEKKSPFVHELCVDADQPVSFGRLARQCALAIENIRFFIFQPAYVTDTYTERSQRLAPGPTCVRGGFQGSILKRKKKKILIIAGEASGGMNRANRGRERKR